MIGDTPLSKTLRGVAADRRATVAIIAAFSLTGLIGMSALAVDVNRGMQQRVVNQRVADMAALAAAIAYSSGEKESVLTPTAQDIARVNGLGDATVVATLVTDVPTTGSKAVRVSIETRVPIVMANGIGIKGSYAVGATAMASLSSPGAVQPCIVGLTTSGAAVSTSGGATIDAPDCAVIGAGDVSNGGTRIAAKNITSGSRSVINDYGTMVADAVRYAVNFTSPSWNTNVPEAKKRTKIASAVGDPLGSNSDIAAARSLLGTFDAPRAIPSPTTPSGQDWVFGYSPSATTVPYRRGNSGNFVVPAGNYTIGALRVDGGVTVTFQAGSTITVARGVAIGGGSPVDFGNSIVRVNGGFQAGTGVTFGNGEVSIGSGSVSLTGTNRIGVGDVAIDGSLNIGGGSSLTLGNGAHAFRALTIGGGGWIKAGTGDVDVTGAVAIGGDSTLALGAGNYRFGSAGIGTAIALSGSGVMIMGDGRFSSGGSITTEGGSRLVFGRTANHLINGDLRVAGAALFGAGRYTIAGSFINGTGGTTWPYSSPVTGATYGNMLEGVSVSGFDMAGVDVTFILSGTVNLAGGAKTKLIASPAGTVAGTIASLLVDSNTTNATSWGGGASNVFSGTVHLPNSDVTMSGGSATLSTGQCFVLIANRVIATGGGSAGTACTAMAAASGGGSGAIELVK